MQKTIKFEDLRTSDLLVDALYKGGEMGHAGDDPISKLLYCGNQGGFRYKRKNKFLIRPDSRHQLISISYVILYSSLLDPDWPDILDMQTGRFLYYGDNKAPGKELHDTNKKGNIILRDAFNDKHGKRQISKWI